MKTTTENFFLLQEGGVLAYRCHGQRAYHSFQDP